MYVKRRTRGFGGARGFGQSLTSPIGGDPIISSLFGPRAQPVAGASTEHQGIDYAVPVGTPVLSAGAGTVIFAGTQSGFGNTIEIDNGNGVMTLYGHLSSIGVTVGQTVGDGDQIALSGATGTVSGPNLHFGVYVNGVAVDPTTQIAPALDTTDDTSSYISDSGEWFETDITDPLDTAFQDLTGDLDSTDTTEAAAINPAFLAVGGILFGLVVLYEAAKS